MAVLVLQDVGDRGTDGPGGPLRPADLKVQVLLRHAREDPVQGFTGFHQLPSDALQAPVAGGRIGFPAGHLLTLLRAEPDHLAFERQVDGELDAVVLVDQVAQQLPHRAALAPHDTVEVVPGQGVHEPQGFFALALEGQE